jgi:DNA-binding HxlR family transcriptional regulator
LSGCLRQGPRRFDDIKRNTGGISQQMLTRRLRGLERDGMVTRTIFSTSPPQVEYRLTEPGHSIWIPTLAFARWVQEHLRGSGSVALSGSVGNVTGRHQVLGVIRKGYERDGQTVGRPIPVGAPSSVLTSFCKLIMLINRWRREPAGQRRHRWRGFAVRAARWPMLLQTPRGKSRPITASVLAVELGVSERTLYRDIAELAAQGDDCPIKPVPHSRRSRNWKIAMKKYLLVSMPGKARPL